MSNNNENKLIPRLRFPEFQHSGEWEVKKLGEVLIKNKTKNKDNKINLVETVSNKFGFIKQDEYFENRIVASKDTSNYYVIKKGYFAYNPSRIDVGSLAYKFDNNESIISPLYVSFKAKNDLIDDIFLLNFFNSTRFTEQMIFEGGVRNTLSFENLAEIKISFPSLPEQQKIATCLSSLDEVIAGERQKLALLQQHKKGLLQQLFPQEGETVPRLRFKEFENSGEWEEAVFSDFVSVIDGDRGKNYPKSEEYSSNGYCVFLNAKNVTKNGFNFNEIQFITKEKDELLGNGKLTKLDIVLTTRGSLGQFGFYDNRVPYEHIRINSGMVIIRSKSKELLQQYLYCYCNSNIIQSKIKSQGFGNAIPQLTVALINNLPLKFPKNPQEQQKIASCLSSLDDIITAQTQKIELLEQHKKGLLQGLFPNVNDHG